MKLKHQIFVYGTLLTGEANHHVVQPHLITAVAGAVRGRLYNVGAYPALFLDTSGYEIPGEWLTVTKEGLQAMDRLEGYYGSDSPHNHYERVTIHDVDGKHSGWVYIYKDVGGLTEITERSWREYRLSSRY